MPEPKYKVGQVVLGEIGKCIISDIMYAPEKYIAREKRLQANTMHPG